MKNYKFNPYNQYGDYILIEDHGLLNNNPLLIEAEKWIQEGIKLTIPKEYLKVTKIQTTKTEQWMVDSDEAGEYKGSLYPEKIDGVSMIPVTVLTWKTIPKKRLL